MQSDGSIKCTDNYNSDIGNSCLGIRPVVTMVDGVYIASGTGTEADPYILQIE